MAAFVSKDPKDKVAFDAHWDKILNSSQNTTRTIVAEGQVAGHIACSPYGENLEVTYWLGREFWGKGVPTQALNRMLHLVVDLADTRRGSNGQHRVDKSAAEMRF
jgi:RimJ/RimL family protein N-acetyltransferase